MLKKNLCISTVILATMMFLVANSFGQFENVVFEEDFEGDLKRWDIRGNVKLQRNHAHEGQAAEFGPVPETSGIVAVAKADTNQMYIAFWIMQTKPEDNAFTLYYVTQGNASKAAAKNRMNFKVTQGLLSPVAEGWGDPNASLGVGLDVPIQANTWHQIGVAIDFSKGYELYFAGLFKEPVEDAKDLPFRDKQDSETMNFIVWDDEPHEGLVYLDDVVVGEGPLPFLAVSPKGKLATTWGFLKTRY